MPKIFSFLLCFSCISIFAQNIGIGTATPQTKLDVNGDLALRETDNLPVTAGLNSSIPSVGKSFYSVTTATGDFTIGGLQDGQDGRILIIANRTPYQMTISDENTSSLATQRIRTGTNADIVLLGSTQNNVPSGSVTLIYSDIEARWLVTAVQGRQASDDWHTTGNENTSTATNFLGTTDAASLMFRVDSVQAGYIGLPSDTIYPNTTALGYNAGTGRMFVDPFTGDSSRVVYDNSATFMGAYAGYGMTPNAFSSFPAYYNDNTAIGFSAMRNYAGSGNVAIGKNSLRPLFMPTPRRVFGGNVAIGNNTMHGWILDHSNVAYAGENTIIGSNAGSASSGCVAIGASAGSSGSGDVAIGRGAMAVPMPIASGGTEFEEIALNIAIGYSALASIRPVYSWATPDPVTGDGGSLEGHRNVAIGANAMIATFHGYSNTGIGTNVLRKNIDGYRNTALGDSAAYNMTNGYENTVIGFGAMSRGNIMYSNVLVGTRTGGNLYTGTGNVALGNDALRNNASGNGNVAIGYVAMGSQPSLAVSGNNMASQNVAIGYAAMANNTTVNFGPTNYWNVAVGSNAMYSNRPTSSVNGYYNTGIGANSLYNNATGSNNVAIGGRAGYNQTNYENSVFIGKEADATVSGLTNATAIGYNAKVGASNNLILGGTGSYAVNVGINTTTSHSNLQIQGSFASTVTSVNANYVATNRDHIIVAKTGCTQVSLPDPTGISGRHYYVKNLAGSSLSINCATGALIDGVASMSFGYLGGGCFVTDGIEWFVLY